MKDSLNVLSEASRLYLGIPPGHARLLTKILALVALTASSKWYLKTLYDGLPESAMIPIIGKMNYELSGNFNTSKSNARRSKRQNSLLRQNILCYIRSGSVASR